MPYAPCSGDKTDCGCGCSDKAVRPLTFGRLGDLAYSGAVGEPITTAIALAAAAVAVADYLGFDLGGALYDIADSVVELVGFDLDSCSKENREKYDRIVSGATPDQLIEWLKKRRVHTAMVGGTCNEYALRKAAKRAKALSLQIEQEAARQPTQTSQDRAAERQSANEAAWAERKEEVRRQFQAQGFTDAATCQGWLRTTRDADNRARMAKVWAGEYGTDLYTELLRQCPTCAPMPPELELIGVGEAAWCRHDPSHYAQLMELARSLTEAERAQLLAAGTGERGEVFRRILESRSNSPSSPNSPTMSPSGPIASDAGTNWMLWAVLGLLGAAGVGYLVFGRGD